MCYGPEKYISRHYTTTFQYVITFYMIYIKKEESKSINSWK